MVDRTAADETPIPPSTALPFKLRLKPTSLSKGYRKVETHNRDNANQPGEDSTSNEPRKTQNPQTSSNSLHVQPQRNERMAIRRLIRRSRKVPILQPGKQRTTSTDIIDEAKEINQATSLDIDPLPRTENQPSSLARPLTTRHSRSSSADKWLRQALRKNKVSIRSGPSGGVVTSHSTRTDDKLTEEPENELSNPRQREAYRASIREKQPEIDTKIKATGSEKISPQSWQTTVPKYSMLLKRKERTEIRIGRELRRLAAETLPLKRRKLEEKLWDDNRPACKDALRPAQEDVLEVDTPRDTVKVDKDRKGSEEVGADYRSYAEDETTIPRDEGKEGLLQSVHGFVLSETAEPTANQESHGTSPPPSPGTEDSASIHDEESIAPFEDDTICCHANVLPIVRDDPKPTEATSTCNDPQDTLSERSGPAKAQDLPDRRETPSTSTPDSDNKRDPSTHDVSSSVHDLREFRVMVAKQGQGSRRERPPRASLDEIPVPRKKYSEYKGEQGNSTSNSACQNTIIDLSKTHPNPKNPIYHDTDTRRTGLISRDADVTSHAFSTSRLRDSPSLFNENAVSVEQFIERVHGTGYLQFVEGFQMALQADSYNKDEILKGSDYFLNAGTYSDAWRLSFILESSSQIIREMRRPDLEPLQYNLKSRVETRTGVFMTVLHPPSERLPWRLRQFDVVMEVCQTGLTLIGVHIDFEDRPLMDGIPLIILGWYRNIDRDLGLYRVGNVRHIRSMLDALHIISSYVKPGIRETFYMILSNSTDGKRILINEVQQCPSIVTKMFDTGQKKLRPSTYITALEHAKILNDQQTDITLKVVDMLHSWVSRHKLDRAELQRFFLVSGVPGCGKTHTAVYMISAIISYFDERFLQEGEGHFDGQILVLTKTNKALDVFSERLTKVKTPDPTRHGYWISRTIPCFCKRSSSYTARDDVRHKIYAGQSDDPHCLYNTPLVLSTFGSIMNLYHMYEICFTSERELADWIARFLKVVIVDEGSQSSLLDLIQFLYAFPSFDGVIIILGDPKQMGPVVLTNIQEARALLKRHLFDEFHFAIDAKAVSFARMTIQYRMHRDIMNFANDVAYEGCMKYGGNEDKHKRCSIPEILTTKYKNQVPFHPVTAYTTSYAPRGLFSFHEYTNIDEIRVAQTIIELAVFSGMATDEDFVFISPYKEQCTLMKNRAMDSGLRVSVHTVASFQGDEEAIVIYSLVRREGSGIGFLDQKEMLSVAITRAIHRLIIIGDLSYIEKSTSGIFKKVLRSLICRKYVIHDATEILSL